MKSSISVFVAFAIILTAHSNASELEAGQVWTTNLSTESEVRVYIGKLDDEEQDLVHIGITGIPDLKKDPALLIELSPNKPVFQKNVPRGEEAYYFAYSMEANQQGDGVILSVVHIPMKQSVLEDSLLALEEVNVPSTVEFDASWNNWDYFRDTYGIDYESARFTNNPLPEVIQEVSKIARSSFGLLEAIKEAFGGLPEGPKFKTTVGKIKPRTDENE